MNLPTTEIRSRLARAVEIATAAGDLTLQYFQQRNFQVERKADRSAVDPFRAQGAVANFTDLRGTLDHLHCLRDCAPHLLVPQSYAGRTANLRDRLQPGGGAITGHPRDACHADGFHDFRCPSGPRGHPLRKPVGLRESLKYGQRI